MKITDVKTCFKIADVQVQEKTTKLEFNYLDELKDCDGNVIDNKVLSENYARVYLIVVDGEIKKLVAYKQKVA